LGKMVLAGNLDEVMDTVKGNIRHFGESIESI
jgi:hypothetical protein